MEKQKQKQWKLIKDLEQRCRKIWLKLIKRQKLKTSIDSNDMKNETKNDKVFSNYKVDNAIGVQVVDHQSERNCSVKGKIQRNKS